MAAGWQSGFWLPDLLLAGSEAYGCLAWNSSWLAGGSARKALLLSTSSGKHCFNILPELLQIYHRAPHACYQPLPFNCLSRKQCSFLTSAAPW